MNKSLALGFWILLSITVVSKFIPISSGWILPIQASSGKQYVLTFHIGRDLYCDNCYRAYPNGTCQKKTPPCRLTSLLESCFRQNVIAERTFLYIRTGCIMNCKRVDGGSYIRHINTCCREPNFCNRQ